jgi:hypothetical protein
MKKKQPLKETFKRIGGKLNEFDDDSMKAYGDAVKTAHSAEASFPIMLQQDSNARNMAYKVIDLLKTKGIDGETMTWLVNELGFEVKNNQIVGR